MKTTSATISRILKSDSPVLKAMPYVTYGLNKFFNPAQVNQTDELHALAVLGTQLSGGVLVYGIFHCSLKCIISSGVFGGIFTRCYQQTLLMKDLEKILSSIKKHNATLKKQLQEFKEETDTKIASLRVCISDFASNNHLLQTTVTDLRSQLSTLEEQTTELKQLIATTESTVENLAKLKKDERESLERLQDVNKKLETVTELLQEEKKQLSSQVRKLALEINRLSEVSA
jgi:hypothetical protein